jgi:hypothetical protein
MTTITLSKKDFKIIWFSSRKPENIIIELDKKVLAWLVFKWKKRTKKIENMTLKEYILSWEIDNPKNISWIYNNMNDLITNLK